MELALAGRLTVIDGTFASGKTTLVAALMAELKSRSLNAGAFQEVARQDPFLEDALVRKTRVVDADTELHLICSLIAAQLRAARAHEIVISDTGPLNIIAHVTVLAPRKVRDRYRELIDAMTELAFAQTRRATAVYLLTDRFDPDASTDRLRVFDARKQRQIERTLRSLYDEAEVAIIEVPARLTMRARVDWVMKDAEKRGLWPGECRVATARA
jgi:deoxyadenosine/deoxycytidine kinase